MLIPYVESSATSVSSIGSSSASAETRRQRRSVLIALPFRRAAPLQAIQSSA
jgi:hypothetical protein